MAAIFVNFPVADVNAAKGFYTALGYRIDPNFTDENAACVVIEYDSIFLMLLRTDYFATFTTRTIVDATKQVETLVALTFPSREAVDEITEKALAAGGTEPREPQDLGFMYGRAFTDLDGHVWEPVWMDPAAAAGGPPEQ